MKQNVKQNKVQEEQITVAKLGRKVYAIRIKYLYE